MDAPGRPLAPPPAPPAAPVTVGTLVARTFAVWKQNLPRFAAISLAAQVPVLLLGWELGAPFGPGVLARPSPAAAAFALGGGWWLLTLAGAAAGLLQMTALTAGALRHLAGHPITVREMLASGLGRFLPALGAAALGLLAFYAGLLLLVVPGIVVALMFCLAIPVVVAESRSPVPALGRSRAMTKGYRLVLLGACAVIWLVVTGIGLGAAGVADAAGLAGAALAIAVDAIFGSLPYVVPAVAYHDLRVAREGVDTALLARVFE